MTAPPFPETPASVLAHAFEEACMAELQAIKPGNVHVFADGHGMVVADFVRSARAAAPAITQSGLGVGQRILAAVEATWAVVSCNTNLGIVLLAAPLIQAAACRSSLHTVLAGLTREDAVYAYRAIRRAVPGGLGESERHDVRETPQATLLEVMREAEDRDRIARQYARGYEDVMDFGVSRYREAMARWDNDSWALTAVYLGFLARFPDTHLMRKFGMETAHAVMREANRHEALFMACENPKIYLGELLRFDTRLKAQGLNPGTSADLTVASRLVASLEDIVQ
jgi:triphosphoribosyl-dephospho-CoA synthase